MALTLAQGTLLGDRYRLDVPVHKGAASSAWTATDERSQRRVALELVALPSGEDIATRRRRIREAKGASALRHAAIVPVQELFEASADTAAFVLDLHPGETLQDRLDRLAGPLSVEEACRVLLPVAAALEAAHSVGIVHGDLAPDRVVLVTGSAGQGAKVKGFGVAALRERPSQAGGDSRLLYSAPELLQAGARADIWADMWSLGMTLYRCLAGAFPLGAETPEQLARSVREGAVTPVEQQQPDLPADVAALVNKLLSIAPQGRPARLREVRDVLASHGKAPSTEGLELALAPHSSHPGGAADAPSDPGAGEELILSAAAGLAEARDRVHSPSTRPAPAETAPDRLRSPSARPAPAETAPDRPKRRPPPDVKSFVPIPIGEDEPSVSLGSRVAGALLIAHGLVWALGASAGLRAEVYLPPVLLAVLGLVLLAGTARMVDAARVGTVVLGVLFAIAEGALVDGDFALLQAAGYAGAAVGFVGRSFNAGGLLGGLITTMVCITVFSGSRSLRGGELSWLRRALLLRGHILPDTTDAVVGKGYRMTLPPGVWYPASPVRAQKTHEWIQSMVVRPDRSAFVLVAELPPAATRSTYERMELIMYSRTSLFGRSTDRLRFVAQWGRKVDGEECRGARVDTVERGVEITCDILVTGVTRNFVSQGRPLLLIAACAPRTSFPAVEEELKGILASVSLKE